MNVSQKKILRKKLRHSLSNLSDSELEALSTELSINLKNLLSTKLFDHLLGAFSPFQKEPLWFKSWENSSYEICIPHMKSEGQMDFYKADFSKLKNKEYGLELNTGQAQKAYPNAFIIPGLAFSKNGARLGRGKGYFDRYLKDNHLKIGVCFESQLIDGIEMNKHDQWMNYIVTEKTVYKGKI